ncbi:MAG TPA: hemolysin family protein [Pyrinomonadaceae bacterium]|jgi:CBS domain containing-hemolysin-like protein|nr:hemolysin family protein [Pyrinomonadaceae bacterium]
MELQVGLTLVLLIWLSLLATVDMAFGQLSDVGLRRLIGENGDKPERRSRGFLKQILENRPRFGFALSATIQILLVVVAVLITSISLTLFPDPRLVLVGLAAGLILTGIFRQLIPLFISTRNPEGTLLFLLPIVRPFFPVMILISDPFQRLFDRSRKREIISDDTTTEEENDDSDDLQALIDVGEAEGILEEEEGELIHSIIEFGDKRVSEVMTPRPDIVAVSTTSSVREARDVMIESKYSRLPVYREHIDNVEGLIYVRDLLQFWAEGREDQNIRPLIRSVYFIPETKPVGELLEEMQKAHVQLTMVIDEYGGICGLVTVEDILEEIVGEIEDEDIAGEELVDIVDAGQGSYDVLASTEIGKIERLFDMEIEADDFTTIAGLVINESGKVPRVGERLTIRSLEVEVLEADDRRINRLRVKKAQHENASEVSAS